MSYNNHRRRCCFSKIPDEEIGINQPECIETQLFLHQRKAISIMRVIERKHSILRKDLNRVLTTNYGIYADIVGAGKTLAMVALIATSPAPTVKELIPLTNTTLTSMSKINADLGRSILRIHSTLIVVPHSLTKQWEDTLKMCKNLKYIVINTGKRVEKLKEMIQSKKVWADRASAWSNIDYDITLVSNTMYRKFDVGPYDVIWNRVVIDEPHTFVLPKCPEGNFNWLICATPYDILYSGRNWVRRLMGGDYYYSAVNPNELAVIKNDDNEVRLSLALPAYEEVVVECLAPVYLRHGVIRDSLPADALSRLNGNDVEGALEILNCDANSSKSSIVESLISNYKNTAHNEQLEIDRLRQVRNISSNERAERIDRHQAKLDDCLKRIEMIKERVHTEENCPICLDSIDDPCAITDCCHKSFCLECILMSLNTSNKCPMCKQVVRANTLHIQTDIHVKDKSEKKSEEKPTILSKSNTLVEIVKNMTSDARYLIFSEYDNSFRRISYKLRERGIPFEILKGNCTTQQRIIDNYTKGKCQILMLNAGNFGAGLNLQMTTNLIIYHEFRNIDLKSQVIGRAQRPGRTCPLTVTYLKHKNET